MPTYSYLCEKCNNSFELFFYIKDYTENPKCSHCNSHKTNRKYLDDVMTQRASVRKSDSELKTLGDLANRNRDRLSSDEKNALENKHNDYKETKEDSPLPKGMKRLNKQKKTKWT
jgi:putative FmdB family regulatory protein